MPDHIDRMCIVEVQRIRAHVNEARARLGLPQRAYPPDLEPGKPYPEPRSTD